MFSLFYQSSLQKKKKGDEWENMIWGEKSYKKKKEERGCDREESTYMKKK